MLLFLATVLLYFYPRTPVECDFETDAIAALLGYISIHALLWSATSLAISSLL